ncbi:MAG TPA: T9SS type A sorting domain-containing protein, partial [bacterium]|nr:T9SS type A sorting domain-containing protein [bacterium]
DVLIRVFDVRGRLVKMLVHAAQDAGRHTVVWDGADGGGLPVSSGMYFCRLEAGDTALTRKMLLVR